MDSIKQSIKAGRLLAEWIYGEMTEAAAAAKDLLTAARQCRCAEDLAEALASAEAALVNYRACKRDDLLTLAGPASSHSADWLDRAESLLDQAAVTDQAEAAKHARSAGLAAGRKVTEKMYSQAGRLAGCYTRLMDRSEVLVAEARAAELVSAEAGLHSIDQAEAAGCTELATVYRLMAIIQPAYQAAEHLAGWPSNWQFIADLSWATSHYMTINDQVKLAAELAGQDPADKVLDILLG